MMNGIKSRLHRNYEMKRTNNKWFSKLIPLMLLIIFIVAAILAFMPHPPRVPETAKNIQDVEKYFHELTTSGNPSSLSFTVVKDGQIVYNKAFGLADGPNRIPATTQTVYHWWSTTKVLTAVAIFQLQEQGMLNLDDPVHDYLPFFNVEYPSTSSTPVTIRHLLNHSSGLPDNVPAVVGWMHYEGQPAIDQTDFLEKVFPDYAKLQFEPGTQSVYTNVGYMVLGAIIEIVSGEPYEDYIRQHILQPLQMNRTDFIYTESMDTDVAVGMHPLLDIQSAFLPFFYGNRMSGLIREVKDGNLWFYRVLVDSTPPTGLIGPAQDLARFEAAIMNGGELDGTRILSEESIRIMTYDNYLSATNQLMGQGTQGLGWKICGELENLCLEHSGGGPGFGNAVRLLPNQKLGFVLTANSTLVDQKGIMDLAMSMDWEN
jgi:D-alanyl-D-alanine carboxypeptidase